MTRLILIRHGETVLGAQDRYAGHSDTPLTPRGRRQIVRLRRTLARLRPVRIYCSDLPRCRETAALLFPGRTVAVTRRLREIDFGRWEGRRRAEIRRTEGEVYRRWLEDPSRGRPPGGESVPELRRRVRRFASDLARRHPRGTVVLVTHGGVIRALTLRDYASWWSTPVPTAGVWTVEWPTA